MATNNKCVTYVQTKHDTRKTKSLVYTRAYYMAKKK